MSATQTARAGVALPEGYEVVSPALWEANREWYLKFSSTARLSGALNLLSIDEVAAKGLAWNGYGRHLVPVEAVDTADGAADGADQVAEAPAGSGTPVEVDGFLVDPATGEVVGPVVEPGFVVDSHERLEWVLRRMGEVESQMVAIEQTDAVIHARAVLANAERLKADLKRRLESLHYRFDSEIEPYVRGVLANQKTRTLKTLYGSVSLRTVPARVSIADRTLAASVLAEEWPAALDVSISLSQMGEGLDADIARRAVLDLAIEAGDAARLTPKITAVPKGLQAELAARADTGFARTDERETMSIDTGVEA